MNYLAHLDIAAHTQTSLLGNFLGDFVKGNPDSLFDGAVVKGIRLHRFVDTFTDSHPLVKSIKPLFPAHLRRFAPIALDMFWDHCLAKHWMHFHADSLTNFSAYAQGLIEKEKKQQGLPLPVRFEKVAGLVWKGRWFEHYADIQNIDYALQRIASSRSRMAPLEETFNTLFRHYDVLTDAFFKLYPEVQKVAMAEAKKGD